MSAWYHERKLITSGRWLPPDAWRAAWRELTAAAAGSADGSASGERDRDVEILTVAQVAVRVGITERAVRKRIASGSLPARRVGRRWAIEWREPRKDAAA
ncbi:MAG: excisionase family DNA-binding protein [Nocardioidaceae bacterium]